MLITGYHGTTEERANEILMSKKYKVSKGEKEWLGTGIYFYPDINDAYNWRSCDTILHTIIKIEDDELLDIDTPEGQAVYNEILIYLLSLHFKDLELSSPQKNQCAVINLIWNTYEKVKVISASFATEKRKINTLIDIRKRRKEFCVKSNDNIVLIQKIKKGDLDDKC